MRTLKTNSKKDSFRKDCFETILESVETKSSGIPILRAVDETKKKLLFEVIDLDDPSGYESCLQVNPQWILDRELKCLSAQENYQKGQSSSFKPRGGPFVRHLTKNKVSI